jgi:hypothetical protein
MSRGFLSAHSCRFGGCRGIDQRTSSLTPVTARMGGDLHMRVHGQASPLKHQFVPQAIRRDPGVLASIAAQTDDTTEVPYVQIPSNARARAGARPGLAVRGLAAGRPSASGIRLDPGSRT